MRGAAKLCGAAVSVRYSISRGCLDHRYCCCSSAVALRPCCSYYAVAVAVAVAACGLAVAVYSRLLLLAARCFGGLIAQPSMVLEDVPEGTTPLGALGPVLTKIGVSAQVLQSKEEYC